MQAAPRYEPRTTAAGGVSADAVWEAEELGAQDASALLLVIHGGFWRARVGADSIRPLAVSLAAGGNLVWNLEYPRSGMPGGGWPGTAQAIGEALDAALLQAGGRPVLVLGHSAGAHLALWGARGRPLAGVLALSPIVDLVGAAREDLGEGAVEAFLGARPEDAPARYAEASPLGRVPLGVSTVLVHGGADDLVPVAHSRRYALAASAVGDPVVLVELEEIGHMQLIDPAGPARSILDEEIERLVREAESR